TFQTRLVTSHSSQAISRRLSTILRRSTISRRLRTIAPYILQSRPPRSSTKVNSFRCLRSVTIIIFPPTRNRLLRVDRDRRPHRRRRLVRNLPESLRLAENHP